MRNATRAFSREGKSRERDGRFRFHGQSRFDLYDTQRAGRNSFAMTAKFTGRYTASPRSPLFPFPPGSRLIGMLVSAFVGAGGGSREDLERVDVLVPSLASQRGSWRRAARDSLNLAFTNQRAAASTRKSKGSERRRRSGGGGGECENDRRENLNENEQERDVERDERRAGQFRSLSFRVFALGGSQPDKKKKLTRRQR